MKKTLLAILMLTLGLTCSAQSNDALKNLTRLGEEMRLITHMYLLSTQEVTDLTNALIKCSKGEEWGKEAIAYEDRTEEEAKLLKQYDALIKESH